MTSDWENSLGGTRTGRNTDPSASTRPPTTTFPQVSFIFALTLNHPNETTARSTYGVGTSTEIDIAGIA